MAGPFAWPKNEGSCFCFCLWAPLLTLSAKNVKTHPSELSCCNAQFLYPVYSLSTSHLQCQNTKRKCNWPGEVFFFLRIENRDSCRELLPEVVFASASGLVVVSCCIVMKAHIFTSFFALTKPINFESIGFRF